ncbi:hypothetical protein Taro_029963 [Colocasia esculenta]|uniref:C3H1-type domain-containing protein n=1 Tax=Colocasia esculenta TaxID=4460 RepID=A0A843VWI1_COLES|nr:hypothetical protein [Colocasia esculenta]
MCSGPDTLKRKPAMAIGHAAGEGADDVGGEKRSRGAVLLELSAADDLAGFRRAVEQDGLDVDLAFPWYGRWGRRMGLEPRTPLMVAAMYGSTAVLGYILATGAADVNRSCGSDQATALHCAAAGGAPSCVEAARLLVEASASVDAVDAAGNRPGDVIPRKVVAPGGSPKTGPLENARRRDPRKYHYSCVPCPEFRKGACRNGDACDYAHGVFESWLHPAQYRTRLCKDEVGCTRRVCFFAHKPEELRAPTSPAGSVLPSPRSPALPPLDVATAAAAASLMLNQPLSPTAASSAMAAASVWLNQAGTGMMTPTRQLAGSRLKAGLSARKSDIDMDLLSLDGYQKQLLDEYASLSSPKSWKSSLPGAAASSLASDYGELLGSLESPSLLSQLQGLSLRQSQAATGTGATQFQSPAGIQMHQNMSQQLLSGYSSSNLPSSPSLRASSGSSFGIDHSLAAAIMNSRSSAFAKRSQSFIDRGAMSRLSGLSTANTVAAGADLSSWGSPDGKLDWGIQGEELNKLRKSASFGIRSNGMPATMAASSEEPDVSWVQSLVKDGPPLPGHFIPDQQQKQHQVGGFGELRAQDVLSPWVEQLYMEQEQLVA